jgi:hypothetical protein
VQLVDTAGFTVKVPMSGMLVSTPWVRPLAWADKEPDGYVAGRAEVSHDAAESVSGVSEKSTIGGGEISGPGEHGSEGRVACLGFNVWRGLPPPGRGRAPPRGPLS